MSEMSAMEMNILVINICIYETNEIHAAYAKKHTQKALNWFPISTEHVRLSFLIHVICSTMMAKYNSLLLTSLPPTLPTASIYVRNVGMVAC